MSLEIYKTAALALLTGILGSGKTLRAVRIMKHAVAQGEKVYQSGFKGLAVSGVIDWEDPREWQSLPPGAILFVDEAQKWFGERRSGHAPAYLKAMNTARGNEGIRFVLLTQHPKYLDAHIKDLVGCHEHLLRESGRQQSKLYRSDEIMEDPRSPRARGKADYEMFVFDPSDFTDYVSADSGHTIKYRMPSLVKKAIIYGGGGALVLGTAWFLLFREAYSNVDANREKAPAGGSVSATPTPNAGGRSTSAAPRALTPAEYAVKQIPRFPMMPWTAEIFDDRPVTADPQLFCVISAAGEAADGEYYPERCSCRTEQGTRYALSNAECRTVALDGQPYNPYRAPAQERAGAQPASMAQSAAPAPEAASVAISTRSNRGVEQYGTMRDQSPSADPTPVGL